MKKESMSSAVKNMMCALRAMVKRKARSLKARLIIYSLLAQTNFLVSSIPLTTVIHQQNHCQIQTLAAAEAVAAAEAAETVAEAEAEAEAEAAAETVAEAEAAVAEGDVGIRSNGSVIEMVKNSKVEAGEEFSLEKDIDHVADLFIRNFHHQMRMQKQNSINRYQQMLFDGTL